VGSNVQIFVLLVSRHNCVAGHSIGVDIRAGGGSDEEVEVWIPRQGRHREAPSWADLDTRSGWYRTRGTFDKQQNLFSKSNLFP